MWNDPRSGVCGFMFMTVQFGVLDLLSKKHGFGEIVLVTPE